MISELEHTAAEMLCRWSRRAKQVRMQQLHSVWQQLEGAVAERAALNDKVKVRNLAENKQLVGCTTSGAAKYRCGTIG